MNNINNNGIMYVDLDLPSGTLWATRNIGANKPNDTGLYFQWGEVTGYTPNQVGTKDWQKRFTWSDYKWNPSGDGKTFTWYLLLNSKLDLEDDAAHVNMGGDWRMPSPEQIKELIDNTKLAWITLDDVNGMTFTSKKDSSKSIFIPAAGYAYEGKIQFTGCSSNIWSSTIDSKNIDCAIELTITYRDANLYSSSHCTGDVNLFNSIRCIGLPVRGVIDGKCNNSNNKNSMKENQRVYIKGNSKRGDEVIKTLIDLGGHNICDCCGIYDSSYYYINPDGVIDYANTTDRPAAYPFLKEFYKEIKLPESNPIKSKGHKHFKPFQKVLIKIRIYGKTTWMSAIYSHYDSSHNKHYLTNLLVRDDKNIIPYEGNEDKLGEITDESEY